MSHTLGTCDTCHNLPDTPMHELGCAIGQAERTHVHEPVIAAYTCACGESAIYLPNTNELAAADHNWRAILRRVFA